MLNTLKDGRPLTYLNVFKIKKFFAVFAIQSSFWAFPFAVVLSFVKSYGLTTRRTGNHPELTLPFMVSLWR